MRDRRRTLFRGVLWAQWLLCLSCAGSRQLGPVISSLPSERHPVLLITAEEIPTIRSRIGREPYSSWWRWAKERADAALSADISAAPAERTKSEYAKALAFTFIVTEETTYAQKAREVLESIVSRRDGGNWGDIHTEMEITRNYCQAYDMIAPYLEGFPDSHRRVRAKIYDEGHRLYTYSSLKETANNWRIRRCAALGLCALTISDYGQAEGGSSPRNWHRRAIEGVMRTIDYQTTSDGGYAEGPNYLRYSADLYIPYLLALHRATGQNLFNTEPLQPLHDWGVKIRLPNGQRPNFDDAALDSFYGGLFAGLSSDPSLHQWDWLRAEDGAFCPGYMKIDAICNFDDGIEAEPPGWNPTLFLPEAGTAVFRSDWSPEAIYMLLLGEHGKVRNHAGAHDQPDPMSFIIYGYGQMLAIDSGYIKWKQRHKVNRAKNHNLILVDGKGPSSPCWFLGWHGGTDAHLQNCFATDFLDYGEVKTRYQGVDFLRSVLFPRHRYFVVTDEVRSRREHQYTWLLHGNGLLSEGTFSPTETGGVWTRNGVSLQAHVAAPTKVAIFERQDIHSFHYGEEKIHSLIAADAEAKETRYLTILYPSRASDGAPLISSLTSEGINGVKIERADRMELIFAQEGEEVVSIPASLTGYGSLRTDARICLASIHDGVLSYIANIEATLFDYDGQTVYASEGRITIALRRSDGGMDGHVKGRGPYLLELSSIPQPEAISFRNGPANFQYTDGKIVLYLEGEGDISLRWQM